MDSDHKNDWAFAIIYIILLLVHIASMMYEPLVDNQWIGSLVCDIMLCYFIFKSMLNWFNYKFPIHNSN